MQASISRYALPLLVGFLALTLAGPIRAFQDGASSSQTPPSKPSGNNGGYTWVMAGEGLLEGAHTSLMAYKAPDGERIETVTAHFKSADAAKTAHQNVNHSAVGILKQENISDESGKVIGERSVLVLVDKDQKKSTAIVITKGGLFREFICASAPDVLAFEKYVNSLPAEHAK
jgi:hypothetical protein